MLEVDFRVAGWTCFAARCLSFVIGVSGFGGIGVVEQKKGGSESEGEVLQESVWMNLEES